jgi:stage V sporulation protein B
VYAVFVRSANGLRRFHTQAGFDVGFSTSKTILLLGLAVVWKVTGAFVGFAAAAAFILVVASRVMRLPPGGALFPTGRIARYMGAVVTYGLLLNVALNYDLPLLHHFAPARGGVDPETVATIAGHYEALRTLALLPYQALLVVTFVIFPLVSRSTFADDREATRAYVTQTLRYALILAAAMGVVLGARPSALLGLLYKPEYGAGAPALPILVAGECCLALLAVACAILNAAGRTRATLSLMTVTVVVGAIASALMVPRAAPGTPMLIAAAAATSLGMASGFVAAAFYLRARFGGGPPAATVVRVAAAVIAAVVAARLVPGHGKLLGLAVIALAGVVYMVVLAATGEVGPAERARLTRLLKRP